MRKNPFSASLQELKNPRCIALTALFIALNVTLDLLNIRIWITPEIRIGFGFILNASVAMLFGPVVGAMAGFSTDVLGYLANPAMGGYFPGYTLTAIVGGMLYGLWLYPCKTGRVRTVCAKASVSLVCNIGMNTLWLNLTKGTAFMLLFPARLLKNLFLLPIEVILIYITTGLVLRLYGNMNSAGSLPRPRS